VYIRYSVLQCVGECCRCVECVFVTACCSALKRVADVLSVFSSRFVAVRYSVLQRVAVCRSMLESIAVCCIAMRCGAMCGSVLLCATTVHLLALGGKKPTFSRQP